MSGVAHYWFLLQLHFPDIPWLPVGILKCQISRIWRLKGVWQHLQWKCWFRTFPRCLLLISTLSAERATLKCADIIDIEWWTVVDNLHVVTIYELNWTEFINHTCSSRAEYMNITVCKRNDNNICSKKSILSGDRKQRTFSALVTSSCSLALH